MLLRQVYLNNNKKKTIYRCFIMIPPACETICLSVYQINCHKCMGTSPEQAKGCSDLLVTLLDGDAIAFVSNPTRKAHLHQASSIPCSACIRPSDINCEGAISHNRPQIASNRTIHEKSGNSQKNKQYS